VSELLPRKHARQRLGALVICAFSTAGASCQTQELRLFDPLGSSTPDAGGTPRDVVPRTTPAPAPPRVIDAGTPNVAVPDTNPQPDCEVTSAACKDCVAAQRCSSPYVCHPSSGSCATACPNGVSDCVAVDAPLCNLTYGVCVQCLSDADCSGGTLACDLAAGVCVQCTSDRHCGVGAYAGLPHCNVTEQACRECVVDADCGGGRVCETSEGHCDDSGGSDSGRSSDG
jgi:Cys-rich repeat protein